MHHSAIFGCKGTQKKLLALAYQALGFFWQLALQILKLKHIVNCNICYSIETLYIIYKYIQGLKLAKESFDLTYSLTVIQTYIYICTIFFLWQCTTQMSVLSRFITRHTCLKLNIVQELCESQGGRPGLSVLTSLLVSVDVKIYCTVLWHWSQLVPNMSHDIWGH